MSSTPNSRESPIVIFKHFISGILGLATLFLLVLLIIWISLPEVIKHWFRINKPKPETKPELKLKPKKESKVVSGKYIKLE